MEDDAGAAARGARAEASLALQRALPLRPQVPPRAAAAAATAGAMRATIACVWSEEE